MSRLGIKKFHLRLSLSYYLRIREHELLFHKNISKKGIYINYKIGREF